MVEKTRFLLVLFIIVLWIPSMVSASAIEKDEILTDRVRPITCGRFIANNTLTINATIENTLNDAIWVKGNLTLPIEFIKSIQNVTTERNLLLTQFNASETLPVVDRSLNSSYLKSGLRGIVSYVSRIENHSSSLMEFRFPVDDTYLESYSYNLKLTWGYYDIFHEGKSELVSNQIFSVTPFEWVDKTTMQPHEMMSSGSGLEITDIVVPDTSIWKGDPFILELTIHNFGSSTMIGGAINAKVREVKELYIGFDREVTAYFGYGLTCIPIMNPGETVTIEYPIGPYLMDDIRGRWALNGAMDAKDFTPEKLWYGTTELSLSTMGFDFHYYTTTYTYIRAFSVKQNPNKHVIFTAVVDDETYSGNPVEFFEDAIDNPIRIGQGMQLEPETTFEEEFGFEFDFYYVGTYDWPDFMHGAASRAEALRNTEYALGQGLGLGSGWTSKKIDNPINDDLNQGFTQRENHGFDVGLGFMPSGFYIHNGEGLAWGLETVCVTMGASIPNWNRVRECALHEICHLFGAIHGEDYATNPFGPYEDGYSYVMQGGNGNDVGNGVWRMHDFTRDRINEFYHCYKFDGAAYPQEDISSGKWYGQTKLEAWFSKNQNIAHVYRLDSDGLYKWDYDPSDYTRFLLAESYGASPEQEGRYISTNYISAEILYPNPGRAYFFMAYEIYWSSDYWPSQWDEIMGFKLKSYIWMYQSSGTTGSSVDYVRSWLISDQSSNPVLYYSGWFKASDSNIGSSGNWEDCHKTWGLQTITINQLTDTSLWFLFGFRDAWSADWSQVLHTHPKSFQLTFDYKTW